MNDSELRSGNSPLGSVSADNLPEAIISFARDGSVKDANAAAESLFGCDRGALCELSVDSLIPGLQERLVSGESHDPKGAPMTESDQFALSAYCRQNRAIPVSVRAGKHGEGELFVAAIREQPLDVVQLNAIFEHSQDGIYLIDPEEYRILEVNPHACEMLGYGREEIIGESAALIHPEEMEQLKVFFGEVLEYGYAKSDYLHCRQRNGHDLSVEVSASLADVSNIGAIVAMVRDVTERKELEARLSRLASLPQENPNPVVELDLSGNVTFVNEAANEVFPLLWKLGGFHPFCAGTTSAVKHLLSEGHKSADFQVEIGGASYAQKITVSSEDNLVRIYATDLTAHKRSEQLQRRLEISEAIKRATLDTVVRLARAAEYRDEDTGAHNERIGRYSAAIARQLDLGEESEELILHGAPMHDVGKIAIPDRILLKNGRLTTEEMSEMKNHTLYGAKLLGEGHSELLKIAERIALSHHEKWDGSGYPNGLTGEHIDINGRIVAVADVFDALRSKRPYKEPFIWF